MVLKLFFTVVSVGFKSASVSNQLGLRIGFELLAVCSEPRLRCHASGEGLIESHCWRTAKCPVRALFSLSWIDDASSVKVMVCCTCSCAV